MNSRNWQALRCLPPTNMPVLQLDSSWQQFRGVGQGLENQGATCYINSVVQCLVHNPILANLSFGGLRQTCKCLKCALCYLAFRVRCSFDSSNVSRERVDSFPRWMIVSGLATLGTLSRDRLSASKQVREAEALPDCLSSYVLVFKLYHTAVYALCNVCSVLFKTASFACCNCVKRLGVAWSHLFKWLMAQCQMGHFVVALSHHRSALTGLCIKSWYLQEDAHDFLRQWLDKVHDLHEKILKDGLPSKQVREEHMCHQYSQMAATCYHRYWPNYIFHSICSCVFVSCSFLYPDARLLNVRMLRA